MLSVDIPFIENTKANDLEFELAGIDFMCVSLPVIFNSDSSQYIHSNIYNTRVYEIEYIFN